MTIVVGVLCNDNSVVIGSDSATTFVADPTLNTIKQISTEKTIVVKESIVIAGTGSVGHQQRFVELVAELWEDKVFHNKGPHNSVIKAGRIISAKAKENFNSTFTNRGTYGALVAIPINKEAKLIEFDSTYFQPEVKYRTNWYVSMGSGQSIADPLLGFIRKMFWDEGPPNLQGGKLAVTMVLKLACEMAPFGVSEPIQMAVLSQYNGKNMVAQKVTEAELAEHDENFKDVINYFRKYQHKIQNEFTESKPMSTKKS